MLIADFYTIITSSFKDSQVEAVIKLNADHPVFHGHFPGHPVVPGVCMLQIFKELTESAINTKLFLNVCTNMKFTALINPLSNPILQLSIHVEEVAKGYKMKAGATFDDTRAVKLSAFLTFAHNPM